MTLMIDLTPMEEARLLAAAEQKGVPATELAHRLLVEHLPVSSPDEETFDPTIALFAQWAEEDAEMTPEEQAEAERELETFKQNLNAERIRAGARPAY